MFISWSTQWVYWTISDLFIFSFCFCHVITNTIIHIMNHGIWNMNFWTSIWHFFCTVKMNVFQNSHSMRTLFLVLRSITFSIIFNVALFVPFELTIDAWFVCTSSTQIDTMLTISALNTELQSRAPEYCSWKTVYCSHTKYIRKTTINIDFID